MKFSSRIRRLLPLAILLSSGAFSSLVHAESHALIMGISAYPEQPLAGVIKDMESAPKIARALGVRPENVVIKRDAELTAAGIRSAMESFAKRLKPGDRAFVYYSGHGTSETGAGGQCVQSLVGHDMKLMPKSEFQAQLDSIGRVASNTVVLLDSCFSGGVIAGAKPGTRGDDAQDVLSPKYYTARMSQAGDACSEADNYGPQASRGLGVARQQPASSFYLLAAASEKEFAIDGGRNLGGLATSSVLACLEEGASGDADRDGVLTFAEAKQCAQAKVNALVKPPFRRQTLVDAGNVSLASTPVLSAPSAQQTVRPPINPSQAIDSRKLLDTIARGADANRVVRLKSAKAAYKIKQDYLDLEITSNKNGYVSLLSVGSSGRIFQLFPNGADSDNKISANVPLSIPREHWKVPSNGPAGSNRFLAIVSSQPFMFSDMGVPVAGRYQAFAPTAENAQRIVQALNVAPANCGQAPQRDFDSIEVNACNTGYGASVIDVQEVN
jgi:metacaspase-1